MDDGKQSLISFVFSQKAHDPSVQRSPMSSDSQTSGTSAPQRVGALKIGTIILPAVQHSVTSMLGVNVCRKFKPEKAEMSR